MNQGTLFKSFVWDAAAKYAVSQIFLAVPFLSLGPLAPIVTWVVTLIADKIYMAIEVVMDLQTIAFKNQAHKEAFDKASLRLKLVAQVKGIDSEEFRKERDAQKEKLSEFVRFNY